MNTNKAFAELEVGKIINYKGMRVVKIARSYFSIRPNENGAGTRMVNAMIEKTGELIRVDGCLCVRSLN